MSSLLLSPSHLLSRRRRSNTGKATAATIAAILILLPSGSTCLPFDQFVPEASSPSLSDWPNTPSPVSSPEVEANTFTIQLENLAPDSNSHSHTRTQLTYSGDLPQFQAVGLGITTTPAVSTTYFQDARPKNGLHPSFHSLARRAPSDRIDSIKRDTSSDFPRAFDTSLGIHFESSTCGPFIEHMVSDQKFQACHPFSLLLSTSNGFFQSLRGSPDSPALNDVLATTCAADINTCAAVMDNFAAQLSASDACGSDLDKRNALAIEAHRGLQNYVLMRAAGCLQSDASTSSSNTSQSHTNTTISPHATNITSDITDHLSTNQSTSAIDSNVTNLTSSSSLSDAARNSSRSSLTYCFQTVSNSTRPDDLYYYYLPSGIGLPSGTQPTCNSCTQTLMKLYSIAASNVSLAIHNMYPAARVVTNAHCGPGFAPAPVSEMANHASKSLTVSVSTIVLSLIFSIFL